jgi:hypothetical protein
MAYTDAVSRISQIQAEFAALQTAFTPAASQSSSSTSASTPASSSASFASQLAQASGTGATTTAVSTNPATGGAPTTGFSQQAMSMLTTDQQQFGARLAADTGLNPQVIAAWMLAEESSSAAQSRQSANNNDWLNIGYTDSGTYGSSDSVWSDPTTAADATAGWIKGQNTIPGYGTAAPGIQAILKTVGQPAAAQIAALQNSGWAGSGYSDLPTLLAQVGGG